MHIYFLENVQSFGGARKSTIELAVEVSKFYNTRIIDINGSCKQFIDACSLNKIELSILDKKNDVKIISSSNFFCHLYNRITFLLYILKINFLLKKQIKEDSIIIVNNSKVLSYLFFKPKNVKIIFFARGWFISNQISKMDRFLYKRLVDKYVCVSQSTKQAIYGAGLAILEKIDVVHNSIDLSKYEISSNENNNIRLLMSGGFLPAKGHLVGIEVAKELKKIYPSFKMIMTGIIYKGDVSKEYYEYLQNLIVKEKLQENVSIVVDPPCIYDFFNWCTIFIHPSDTEGLPRVVMEAMAFKKPVIANAVGGVTDYILDDYTGIITRHNNVKDYVLGIKRLSEQKEFYKYISDNAFQLVNKTFTKEKQIEQFLNIFNQN